jgi:hypothetical protein
MRQEELSSSRSNSIAASALVDSRDFRGDAEHHTA